MGNVFVVPKHQRRQQSSVTPSSSSLDLHDVDAALLVQAVVDRATAASGLPDDVTVEDPSGHRHHEHPQDAVEAQQTLLHRHKNPA